MPFVHKLIVTIANYMLEKKKEFCYSATKIELVNMTRFLKNYKEQPPWLNETSLLCLHCI